MPIVYGRDERDALAKRVQIFYRAFTHGSLTYERAGVGLTVPSRDFANFSRKEEISRDIKWGIAA